MLLLQLQRVFHKGMIFSPPLPLLRSDSILKGWGHFFVLWRVTLFGFPSTGELDEKEILILKKKRCYVALLLDYLEIHLIIKKNSTLVDRGSCTETQRMFFVHHFHCASVDI